MTANAAPLDPASVQSTGTARITVDILGTVVNPAYPIQAETRTSTTSLLSGARSRNVFAI
jgi:hypothetical protein